MLRHASLRKWMAFRKLCDRRFRNKWKPSDPSVPLPRLVLNSSPYAKHLIKSVKHCALHAPKCNSSSTKQSHMSNSLKVALWSKSKNLNSNKQLWKPDCSRQSPLPPPKTVLRARLPALDSLGALAYSLIHLQSPLKLVAAFFSINSSHALPV